jgi:hypothetical protein
MFTGLGKGRKFLLKIDMIILEFFFIMTRRQSELSIKRIVNA